MGEILPFYIVSFLGLYLYFAVSAVADIKGRRRILKTNLVDYLENHMVNRLANAEYAEPENEDKVSRGSLRKKDRIELMPVHGERRESAGEMPAKGHMFSVSEEKELEELLKEFLTS